MVATAPPSPPSPPPPAASLHLVWPKPALMLPMADLLVWVDGHPAWRGPFEKGLDLTVPLLPGRHRVDVRIDVEGLFARNRSYEIDVAGAVRVDLHYSRLWGNFSKRHERRAEP